MATSLADRSWAAFTTSMRGRHDRSTYAVPHRIRDAGRDHVPSAVESAPSRKSTCGPGGLKPSSQTLGLQRIGLVGDEDSWVEQRRPAFSRRAKIVCAECNNGWMSRLEMAAAPLITPMLTGERRVTLNVDDHTTVALWVMKTAMPSRSRQR